MFQINLKEHWESFHIMFAQLNGYANTHTYTHTRAHIHAHKHMILISAKDSSLFFRKTTGLFSKAGDKLLPSAQHQKSRGNFSIGDGRSRCIPKTKQKGKKLSLYIGSEN